MRLILWSENKSSARARARTHTHKILIMDLFYSLNVLWKHFVFNVFPKVYPT